MIPQVPKSNKFAFQEKEYLTIACMKEQISANSKTVQEGRGREFPGSTQVHIYRHAFRMCLEGISKGKLLQVAPIVCRRLDSSEFMPL